MNRGHTCLIQGYSAETDGILAAFQVLIDEQYFEVWGIFDVYPFIEPSKGGQNAPLRRAHVTAVHQHLLSISTS